MGFLFCLQKKHKAKVLIIGDALSTLTISTAVVKTTAEKIAKEKGMILSDAVKFVCGSILEEHDSLK